MADKTIGDLAEALQINDNDLFVLEQGGAAKKLKGTRLVKYAQDTVGEMVTAATEAAESAETAKTGAESAQTQAQAARDAILNMIVEAITLKSGSAATVEKSLVDSVYKLTFGLPRGEKGATGATGPANTLAIGTVEKGTEAAATITGDAPNQTLNLVLPRGEQGLQGAAGADGKSAYESAQDGGYTGTEQQFNSDLASVSDKYQKPSDGIPKSDLASSVQTSLGKADISIPSTEKGTAGGVATLGSDGKVPSSQLPKTISYREV